jgi:hypothetical protein
MTDLQQLQANYNTEAATEMGTPEAEALLNEHVASSELQYSSGAATAGTADAAGSSDDSSSTCSTTTQGAQGIAQEALSLAWPEPFADKPASEDRPTAITPTAAYVAAMQQYNPAEYAATDDTGDDCGVFVATVMRASGADPNYPEVGTNAQASYVIAHPNLYTVTFPATSTSQLQPGDILILNGDTTINNGVITPGDSGGAGGHTFIYVGPQAGGYNEASASLGDRSANLNTAQLTDSRGQYLIAQPKTTGST